MSECLTFALNSTVNEQGIDKRSAKKEAKEIRKYLEEESGLFLEKGKEGGKSLYGFFHLSFQEYFAALELVDKWKKGQIDLNKYVFDSRWIEIVRLGAADLGSAAKRGRYEATEFVKAVLDVEDDFEELKRPLILAGYILSDDVRLEPSIENKIIDDLFYEYLNTDYEELKILIRGVMGELLSSEKEKPISERIKELAKSENVRAVELLRLIELEEALPILSNLANSKSVEVRRAVAFATKNMGRSSWTVRVDSTEPTKKFVRIIKPLIKDIDFITVFNAAVACNYFKVRFPDDLKQSYNLRKYSLFVSSSHLIESPIKLEELTNDNDSKIKEIATIINNKGLQALVDPYLYPTANYYLKEGRFVLTTKNDTELVFFDFETPLKEDIVNVIEKIENSDLPKANVIISDLSRTNTGLVIKNFGRIVNNFKDDLSILVSIAKGLKFHLLSYSSELRKRITTLAPELQSQKDFPKDILSSLKTDDPAIKLLILYALTQKLDEPIINDIFLKTDDPVIKLLISYTLTQEPDARIIKGCKEIFREEKNDKNKKALFSLLHHFLSPFTG